MNNNPNKKALNWSNSTSLNNEGDNYPTNKLSVYLIREGMEDNCLSGRAELDKEKSRDGTEIYKANSFIKRPKFMEQFFHDEDKEVYSSSAQVLLILRNVGAHNRTVAFAFGNGRCLLNQDAIERRFGLKTALNLIDSKSVKKFSKTKLDSNPKNEDAQLSKKARVSEFGIDISQDLIKGVSGAIKADRVLEFGKNVSGTDSLNLRVRCDITNIRSKAVAIIDAYYEDSYRETFDWIDQIQEIKDKALKRKLDNLVIDELTTNNSDKTKVWASVPEFIDEEDLDGYRIGRNNGELMDDIDKAAIIEKLNGKIDLAHLKGLSVFAVSAASDVSFLKKWPAYRCLYAEIQEPDNMFLLLDGAWYSVNNDFVTAIQNEYAAFNYSTEHFIDYNHKDEAEYNVALATSIGADCYDANLIAIAGYDKIELCDVLTRNGDFVHIKKYAGSSVLSHLFNQGLVSGELLKSSPSFRSKAEEKTGRALKDLNGKKVIFGIITKKYDKFDIPFFSKVSFNNVRQKLIGLGYEVEIVRIKNVKPENMKDE